MTEDLKYLVKNPRIATIRVEEFIGVYTKSEISDLLGVSRPTLETRFKSHNWRMVELEKIIKHFPVLA